LIVPLIYLNILITLIQSSKLGLLFFLDTLLTENNISGRVDIAKYNKLPTACWYSVLSVSFLNFSSLIGTVFEVFLYLLISNLSKIFSIYLFWCNKCSSFNFSIFIPIMKFAKTISVIRICLLIDFWYLKFLLLNLNLNKLLLYLVGESQNCYKWCIWIYYDYEVLYSK